MLDLFTRHHYGDASLWWTGSAIHGLNLGLRIEKCKSIETNLSTSSTGWISSTGVVIMVSVTLEVNSYRGWSSL